MSKFTGQSLGRYHILEQLGEGGMATVYKAYDTRLENDVAVKIIRTENLAPSILERSLKRFEREAKSLAKLTHANIVNILDYGEYEGKPYLVMPYLPGGTLKQKLQGKPMQYQEAARLLIPIAKALAYAHQQGMVHRDVKPANILITYSGDPMLTDFGIAKIIDDEATMDLTGTSAAVGTPEYMAPEQIISRSVDHRADIYALGVVYYEMVTGRKPFQADTPMAILFKHASDPLPRPKQFVPSLTDDVEKLLFKAMAKKPENRFASMNEFALALDGLLRNSPTSMETISNTIKVLQQFLSRTIKSIINNLQLISVPIKNYISSKAGQVSLFLAATLLVIAIATSFSTTPALVNRTPETYYTYLNGTNTEIHYYQDNKDKTIFRSVGTSAKWYPAPDKLGNLFYISIVSSGQTEIFALDKKGTISQITHTKKPFSSWSPAPDGNGNLYFVSNRDGNEEIFAINNKGAIKQVTHTSGNIANWSPAPDGNGNLYFISDRDGNKEIFAIDSKSLFFQITKTSGRTANWSPAPDGNGNLYFVSDRDGSSEIYAINSKGKTFQVTDTAGSNQNWSPVPDGMGNLYFTSNRYGETKIFMMDRKSEVQVLTGIPANSWLKERFGNPSSPEDTK